MKYKCILIDLDDTLWDTQKNAQIAIKSVFFDYGLDKIFGSFDAFYVPYVQNNLRLWSDYRNNLIDKQTLIIERFRRVLAPKMNISTKEILTINDDFLERTTQQRNLIPGAIELLKYLKPLYSLYIISNGFKEVQYKKMDNSGLLPFFSGIILSDNVGHIKPSAEIFLAATEQAGVMANEAIVLGDSLEADILGATNAGIDNIWFNQNNEKPSETIIPKHIVKRLLDVKSIL